MNSERLIKRTEEFVKRELWGAEGGHDWFHIERVYKNTLKIAQTEPVDVLIVSLAALLHDIADPKFHNGDESIGPKKAATFMHDEQVPTAIQKEVLDIIRKVSFKNSLENQNQQESLELQVVRDADRLDAIGAIGIARAFNFGGFKGRPLYDPAIPPRMELSKEEYKKANGPTVNHFYEKLLLLKDLMHTETGKRLAEQRHGFMLQFLEAFYREWDETADNAN